MKTMRALLFVMGVSLFSVLVNAEGVCDSPQLQKTFSQLEGKQKRFPLTEKIRKDNLKQISVIKFWTRLVAIFSSMTFSMSLAVVMSLFCVLAFHKYFADPTPGLKLAAYGMALSLFHLYFFGSVFGLYTMSRSAKLQAEDFSYVSSQIVNNPPTAPSALMALQTIDQARQELLKVYYTLDSLQSRQSLSLSLGWDQYYLVGFEETLIESLYRIDKIENAYTGQALSELKARCPSVSI